MGLTQNLGLLSTAIKATSTLNVGIGTSSPTSKLHIYNSGADAFSTLETTTGFSAYNRNKNGNRSWVYGIDGTSSNWIVFDETASAIRLAITSGGNVGIGTSTISTGYIGGNGSLTLQNSKSIAFNNYSDTWNTSTTGGAITYFTDNNLYIDAKDSASNMIFRVNGANERMRITSDGIIQLSTTSSIPTTNNTFFSYSPNGYLYLQGGSTGLALAGSGNRANAIYVNTSINSILFYTNDTGEKMRVTGDGLIVGGTNIAYTSSNRGNITLNGSSNNILAFANGTTSKGYLYHTGTDMILQNDTSGNLYATNGSGGVYLSRNGTSWTSNSDERLKDINSEIENAVDKIKTLRAVNFSWKADESKREVLGLIAQDVEKVFPQVVDKNKFTSKADEEQTDETEYLGVRYQDLVPVLVAAIQELKAEIDELKNK